MKKQAVQNVLSMIQQKLQTMRRQLAPLAALAVLLLVGCLVLLAAHGSAPKGTASNSLAGNSTSGSPAISSTARATKAVSTAQRNTRQNTRQNDASTPTATTAPDATPTDSPGATPTPTDTPPTPTATPAPTWHTLGSWSGSTGDTLSSVALIPGATLRLDWTCSSTPATWDFQYSLSNLNNGGIISCNAEPSGSQLIGNTTGATSTALTIIQDGAMGNWTVTIEEYS